MIKAIREVETPTTIIRSRNRCMVHFLDIMNINLTNVYLKSAWNAGAVGAYDLYLLVKDLDHVATLDLREIFDFKRLLIATTPRVWKLI